MHEMWRKDSVPVEGRGFEKLDRVYTAELTTAKEGTQLTRY